MAKKVQSEALYLAEVYPTQKRNDTWIDEWIGEGKHVTDRNQALKMNAEYVKQVIKQCSTAEKPLKRVPA